MTPEQLELGKKLEKEILHVNTLLDNLRRQKCEFIYFSFGNGSNKETVCDDLEMIETVRNILAEYYVEKIDNLKKQFDLI